MSNELRLNSATITNTYYALVLDNSGNVADISNNVLTAWVAANIGDYDVQLTYISANLFLADMPSFLADGKYVIQKYRQVGASPVFVTDVLLSSEEINWFSGTAVGVAPAGLSAFALIQLNQLKALLNISTDTTDQDSLLTQLINAATFWMEKVCSRQFAVRTHKETVWVNDSNMVILNHAPIIRIEKIGFSSTNAIEIENDTDLRAMVIIEPEQMVLITTDTLGAKTTTELLFSTYPTVLQLTVAINAVSHYIATVDLNGPSEELIEMSGKDCTQGPVNVQTIEDSSYDANYHIHPDIGAISLGRIGAKCVYVHYKAGFETIPYDLANVCGEVCRIAYHMVHKDPTRSTDVPDTDTAIQRSVSELNADQHQVVDAYKLLNVASNFFG